jgi:ubiquinone/menaquinone biosynthesis C-methylase UbiE
MDEETLKGIAAQLRKPVGDWAIKVGEMMNAGNALVNTRAIEQLAPSDGDNILELGMGNGYFAKQILDVHPAIKYTGCDYSEQMVQEAGKQNTSYVMEGRATFYCNDGATLTFDDAEFDKILTVNTIYFWDDREAVLSEITRVLKPGGALVIGIRPQDTMKEYPMTKYGFAMYSAASLQDFLTTHGYMIAGVREEAEPQQEIGGKMVDVASLIVHAVKQ